MAASLRRCKLAAPMSTATLHPSSQQPPARATSAQGHRQHLRTSNPHNVRSASNPQPSRPNDRDPSSQDAEQAASNEALAPAENSVDSKRKQVGQPSRRLKVTDFELMRTLGTGENISYLVRNKTSLRPTNPCLLLRDLCARMALSICPTASAGSGQGVCFESAEKGGRDQTQAG